MLPLHSPPLYRSVDEKVKIVASPKIPLAKEASKHKAGGGNVEIRQCTMQTALPNTRIRQLPHYVLIACSALLD